MNAKLWLHFSLVFGFHGLLWSAKKTSKTSLVVFQGPAHIVNVFSEVLVPRETPAVQEKRRQHAELFQRIAEEHRLLAEEHKRLADRSQVYT